ncbi:MAG: glycoside hydrolase, partial [Terriglobia bacterium]
MKTIYLVPHTHYDVVWAFVREDYLYINTSILKKALEMIKSCGFKFLIEQTYPIEQIEKDDPPFFAELKDAIRAGKVEVVDAQYVMADPMTPAGEVLVRQFLVGHLYCQEKLGIEVPVGWAADGFGLNAQLPQIYRKCGFRWLVFRRGLPRSIGYRVSEFLWEGLDGSKIIAHWLPLGYRAGLDLDHWEQTV